MRNNISGLLKRKPILSLAVGAVAFSAALAFAASLTVDGGSLGAGNAAVSSCDQDGVDVAYTSEYDSSMPGFKVTEVEVSGIDVACDGNELKVEVVDSSDGSLASGTVTIAGTSETVTLSTDADAEAVANVHAVISG